MSGFGVADSPNLSTRTVVMFVLSNGRMFLLLVERTWKDLKSLLEGQRYLRGPRAESWEQIQTRNLYFMLCKTSVSCLMSVARGIRLLQSLPPPRMDTFWLLVLPQPRGAMLLAWSFWIWGNLMSSFLLLLSERQFLSFFPPYSPCRADRREVFWESTSKLRDFPSHTN